ncbi:TetR/AcrR family transcriptional regulator [Mesobacillus sp. AQ2]|uniref:TetR/AcrR family transcriptional regulator n=1 Tax=unclassified Mesobacillus TaxID=2675270 RepID=UPI00203F551E|nr:MULTISPECIES: TetR/AcrR family transcriptional regulator [unclassified Mesobacillus]MCM3123676.1 TetR/AcrR family transcriptional regulator [Mesobacillus sp. MER 33]MCM3234309.1 TetR/AcrR family transcriptional regulator [Mesobacillus sp. MER 48]WHX40547.1 TetR/AcrR family transcriptional regulator [Mesobacillus sp. AQ2]
MTDPDLTIDELMDGEELTDKQKKIIVSAIESFAEKGFSATSTSEIAKKAGVAEGTIFRHYKTKKDLLLAIVSPVMAKFVAPFIIKDLKKILHQDYEHFEDFLTAMLMNRRDFLVKNLATVKILVQEIPFHPELKELFKEHIALKVYAQFERLVEHYQAKGQIIDIPAYSVFRMTFSSIFGYLIARYMILPEADWDDEAETERTIQFIMHGLAGPNSKN